MNVKFSTSRYIIVIRSKNYTYAMCKKISGNQFNFVKVIQN